MCDLEVTLPCETLPARATSLVTCEPVETAFAGGRLTLSVPRLEAFEAIKLEW
jgi:hypothetical protein